MDFTYHKNDKKGKLNRSFSKTKFAFSSGLQKKCLHILR